MTLTSVINSRFLLGSYTDYRADPDHGHSSQIVPVGAEPMGLSATLVTDEGGLLMVSYATTTTPEDRQEHTGTRVRIAAQRPFAERVSGITDQTRLFTTITGALALR